MRVIFPLLSPLFPIIFIVVLPIDSSDKRSLGRLKKRLVGQSFSDQLVVLKAFRVSAVVWVT